jgi:hypothetical protein
VRKSRKKTLHLSKKKKLVFEGKTGAEGAAIG